MLDGNEFERQQAARLALMSAAAVGRVHSVDPDISVDHRGVLRGVRLHPHSGARKVSFEEFLCLGKDVLEKIRSISFVR